MTTVRPIYNTEPDNLSLRVLHQQAQLKIQRGIVIIMAWAIGLLVLYDAVIASLNWLIVDNHTKLAADVEACHKLGQNSTKFVYAWSENGCEALLRNE